MLSLPLPIKAIIREWRTGELTLLFIALIVAVACVSAMNNFTGTVKNKLEQSARNMLGADAVFTSKSPIKSEWLQKSRAIGLSQTISLSFPSMVEYQNQLQLAQIKAISTPYPLRGGLKIANNLNDSSGKEINQAPVPGTVWLEPRLFSILATDIGKTINIGSASFKITGVIRDQPGQTGDWFTISPRIIINLEDVVKTKVIQPGSNLSYNWLLNGSKQQLNEIQDFLNKTGADKQQWMDSQNRNQRVTETLDRTLSYLSFSTVLSMILAGVAISMASLRYCLRHLKQVALLRCFGASQRQVMQLYISSIGLLGIIACILGAVIGYAFQPVLVKWLGGLLPQIEQQFTLWPLLLSIITGMLLLFCFSVGTIWQLRKVSAITLFRQYQIMWENTLFLTYGMALLLLTALAYVYTDSFKVTLSVLLGCLGFIGIALFGLWLLFAGLIKTKVRISLSWRFGFINIAHNLNESALQVIGIGLALTAMLSLTLLKNHLLSDWQQQLPAQTANYFVINIEPEQTPLLNKLLAVNQIKSANFYPMVRGRLIAINQESVNQRYGERAKDINALQRELNLSWSDTLPDSNRIVDGTWVVTDPSQNWVSVDKGLAETLAIKLGDVLLFRIGDREINARISSFRQVDWNSFKPNFFMLFKPGLLNELPQTMITSFYLPPEKQYVLLQVNKQFPNVTVIDVADTINKIRTILTSAGNAITFISFFALLIGLVIVTLAILSFSSTKLQETKILKILGMRRKTLLWIRSSEAFLIGIYSGVLATGTAILINSYLAEAILNSRFAIPWLLFITVPLTTAILTIVINLIMQRKQYQSRSAS
ncbi:ABC transporter permease [Legionella maioricensis]|uniref:FtsX-like permease family protein n=1 Tax=Legionella maioricensis TaxID=2896528 RepID=A0A9X2D115_9GAMM|nr:FtsX-like permease family protein [Legionella maioricensis]MCL9683892.1 FtsX-like permease family protein [Legionella maioricensis]MCL9686739.1 FtsX-like permease family protein [Legionella maioricensis]